MSSSAKQTKKQPVEGSSRKTGGKILGLVTPARAEAFLTELANLRDELPAQISFLAKFNDMLPHPQAGPPTAVKLRSELRRAWDSNDPRVRDWHIFLMRLQDAQRRTLDKQAFFGELDFERLHDLPPSPTPIEAALVHLHRIGDRAKHCGYVDCPAPYFIAKKRWQKFCSEACAAPANRESKLKWWRENRAGGSQ